MLLNITQVSGVSSSIGQPSTAIPAHNQAERPGSHSIDQYAALDQIAYIVGRLASLMTLDAFFILHAPVDGCDDLRNIFMADAEQLYTGLQAVHYGRTVRGVRQIGPRKNERRWARIVAECLVEQHHKVPQTLILLICVAYSQIRSDPNRSARLLALIPKIQVLGRPAHPVGSRKRKSPSLARSLQHTHGFLAISVIDWLTTCCTSLPIIVFAVLLQAAPHCGPDHSQVSTDNIIHETCRTGLQTIVHANKVNLDHGVIKNRECGVDTVPLLSLRKLASQTGSM
jgi:hypothetical protein